MSYLSINLCAFSIRAIRSATPMGIAPFTTDCSVGVADDLSAVLQAPSAAAPAAAPDIFRKSRLFICIASESGNSEAAIVCEIRANICVKKNSPAAQRANIFEARVKPYDSNTRDRQT